MKKVEKFINSHLHLLRRISQIGSLVLIIAIPFLNKSGINILKGTYYSISIGELDIIDPAIALQMILLTKSILITVLLMMIVPVVLAMILGKVFCSWACPFNFIAELLGKLKKSPSIHSRNPKTFHYWTIFGIILLSMTVFGIPIIVFISMPGQISALIADAIFNGILGIEILLVIVILAIEFLFNRNFWCKYVCPVGATLSLFRIKKTIKVTYEPNKCAKCEGKKDSPCIAVCPLNLNPRLSGAYPYCYNCFECVNTCRKNGGALNISFEKKLN